MGCVGRVRCASAWRGRRCGRRRAASRGPRQCRAGRGIGRWGGGWERCPESGRRPSGSRRFASMNVQRLYRVERRRRPVYTRAGKGRVQAGENGGDEVGPFVRPVCLDDGLRALEQLHADEGGVLLLHDGLHHVVAYEGAVRVGRAGCSRWRGRRCRRQGLGFDEGGGDVPVLLDVMLQAEDGRLLDGEKGS